MVENDENTSVTQAATLNLKWVNLETPLSAGCSGEIALSQFIRSEFPKFPN